MKKKFLLAGVAALGLATAANAAIIVNVTNAASQPPTGGTSGTLGSGYTGLVISLSNSTGKDITAIDLNNGVNAGFLGQLQQRWSGDVDEDGFLDPTPIGTALGANGTVAGNLDSHFLFAAANQFADLPSENNNVSGSPLADTATADYGTGSFLKGTVALTAAGAATPSVNVAYLVIKNDQTITVSGFATERDNPTAIPFSKTIAVPEPASVGLLGMAAAGLFGRRRRQA